MHHPVLLSETIEGLGVKAGGRYIDATVGEGGHTVSMLRLGAHVLGIDADLRQINRLAEMKKAHGNLTLAHGNFCDIAAIAKKHGFDKADGILFDLGLSWEQLASLGRGLSYKKDEEPLDMRLDESIEQDAAFYLNMSSEEVLTELFMKNAEEPQSGELASSICLRRRNKRFETVADLNACIKEIAKNGWEKMALRVYQALRVEVNAEYSNLRKGLTDAVSIISPVGRIAVISFHSREDRIVKRFISEHHLLAVTKKAIPGNQSISYERSAKLRIFSL